MGLRVAALSGVLLLSSYSVADWVDQETILDLEVGDEDHQYGVFWDGVYTSYPGGFSISKSGYIVMEDDLKNKLSVYNPDGTYRASVTGSEIREMSPEFIGDTVLTAEGGEYLFLDLDLNLKNKVAYDINGKSKKSLVLGDHYYKFRSDGNQYWANKFNDQGELVEKISNAQNIFSFKRRTLMIERSAETLSQVTINNKTWTLDQKSGGSCTDYLLDKKGDLYCRRGGGMYIVKYNICGRKIGSMGFWSEWEEKDGEAVEVVENILWSTIDQDGNLYATLISPERYKLLKWTWEDEEIPDAGPSRPFWPRVKAHDAFVDILWNLAIQDPGCVTEYKIFRTETEENIEKQIGTVSAGVEIYRDTSVEAGKEYTYRLKAASSLGDSEFSDSVTVTVPE